MFILLTVVNDDEMNSQISCLIKQGSTEHCIFLPFLVVLSTFYWLQHKNTIIKMYYL